MKTEKLLLIHHTKDFSNNAVYLSDDFYSANLALFGAQELDTWGGYRLLTSRFKVYRLQISINLQAFQLISPDGDILYESSFWLPSSIRDRLTIPYLSSFLKYFDSSICLFCDPQLKHFIQYCLDKYGINKVWVETQFYELAVPFKNEVIIRSVNFEPVHVLREDPSKLRYLRCISKLISERKISRRRRLVSISPNDSLNYSFFANVKPQVIPLRQLPFMMDQAPHHESLQKLDFIPETFFHFSGSNYDVKHNRINLDMILGSIAPKLNQLFPEVSILIFGHRVPQELIIPSNVKYMHFHNDYYSIIKKSRGAIVPNRGGAGMQSKIFEPLALGIPLIAHQDAIAGFPFNPQEHFYDGSTTESIILSLSEIMLNPERTKDIAERAKELSKTIFARGNYIKSLAEIL